MKLECKDEPTHYQLKHAESYTVSCARDEHECKRMGNYVAYDLIIDDWMPYPYNYSFVRLTWVEVKTCKPKPEKCNCTPMIQEVLERNPGVNRMDVFLESMLSLSWQLSDVTWELQLDQVTVSLRVTGTGM